MKIANSPLFEKTGRRFTHFLIYLLMCLALFAIDSRMNYLEAFRTQVKSVILPLQLVLERSFSSVSDGFNGFLQTFNLQKEKDALQRRELRLALKVASMRQVEKENESLRSLLSLNSRQAQNFLVTEVVTRKYVGTNQKVLVDKGLMEGVRLGLPVGVEEGLFGQVSSVFDRYAEVTQITNLGMSVPAVVKGTSIYGVVYGTGSEFLEFRHFPQRFRVNVGDEILTSGLDGLFNPNVPIARVTRIQPSLDGSGMQVLAQPEVSFSTKRFVVVSLKRQKYAEWLESLDKPYVRDEQKKASKNLDKEKE